MPRDDWSKAYGQGVKYNVDSAAARRLVEEAYPSSSDQHFVLRRIDEAIDVAVDSTDKTVQYVLQVMRASAKNGDTELYLHDRQLSTLPGEIGLLTNLSSLDLHNNSLTMLPTTIRWLTNLTELKLYRNPLDALPSEIGLLTNLSHLDLLGTRITDVDLRALKTLNSLKHLNVEGTRVSRCGVAAFTQHLPKCVVRSDFENSEMDNNAVGMSRRRTPKSKPLGEFLSRGRGG